MGPPIITEHNVSDYLNHPQWGIYAAKVLARINNPGIIKPKNSILPRSRFFGVYWHNTAKKWIAKICIEGRLYHLGLSVDETEAAKIYNKKALELFGPTYKKLNKDTQGDLL